MSANDEIQFHIAAIFVLDLDYGPAGDQNSKPDMTQKGYPRLFHWPIRSLGRLSLANRIYVSIFSHGGGKPHSKKRWFGHGLRER